MESKTGGPRFGALLGGLSNAAWMFWYGLRRSQVHDGPKTVLITGASVGIGLALAQRLLRDSKHRLILTARQSSLTRFADAGIHESPRVRLRALDVTDHDQRVAIINEAERDWQGVDVLVNNAGISYRSVAEHVSNQERLDQMDINFRAPMALTTLVLPTMRRKCRGHILNVSSVGGMSAMPTMSVYSASKFALEGASEALWYEVRPWNIHVTLVQPGFIHSDGFKKVRFTDQGRAALRRPHSSYHAHYRHMEQLVERLMTLTWATSETVAATLFTTMHRRSPPLRVAGTLDAMIFDWARRFLPRRLYHALLYAGLPEVWNWGPSTGLSAAPTRHGTKPGVPSDR